MPLKILGRIHFFLCGVVSVRVTGEPQADRTEVPILIIAPHTSFYDAIIMVGLNEIPSNVGRIENSRICILGSTYTHQQMPTTNCVNRHIVHLARKMAAWY